MPLSTAALALSLLLGLDRCFGLGLDVWLHLLCADGGYVVGTYRSRGIARSPRKHVRHSAAMLPLSTQARLAH